MMKTRMMKCCKLIAFCFFKRAVCFFFIIASIFHFGQSLTSDNPEIHIQDGAIIANSSEGSDETAEIDNEASPKITVTGKEHFYIAGGEIYGLQDTPAKKTTENAEGSSPRLKTKSKKEEFQRKTVKDYTVHPDQKITTQPERNSFYAASLSGQTVCVAPGSHYQNFIFYHTIRYISAIQHEEYIEINYHYRYSVFSKNIIDGGGIRPPPFYC
ncbi:hypothetical protein [Chryseobacterium hispalense]|uniref:hypothetical protein n=1 Tax=Chryseobacterium hispalense TaxID=1453492 RepID=UPI00391B635A